MEDTIQINAYKSAVSRGKVTPTTTENDFLLALQKEVAELFQAKELGNGLYVNERVDLLMRTANKKYSTCSQIIEESKPIFKKVYQNNLAGTKIDELADIVILCNTYAEFLGISLETAVRMKMHYNTLRSDNIVDKKLPE